jgi:putative hydrolase of the HAD superfamily
MHIQSILFDADGVIQRPSMHRRGAWQQLLGQGRDVDEFVAAVFEVERQALEGRSDFIGAFSRLLVEWRCQGTLQDALAVWTMIEPDLGMTRIVKMLRRNGLRCYLATNQEPYRASYMSEHLGYRRLFDQEFYSCRMGVAKPATAYFRAIVDELDLAPGNVLFLDDHDANVSSARELVLTRLSSGSIQVHSIWRGCSQTSGYMSSNLQMEPTRPTVRAIMKLRRAAHLDR